MIYQNKLGRFYKNITLLLLIAFVVGACNSNKKVPTAVDSNSKTELAFTYEKTACFGTCPQYKIEVYHGGETFYMGQQHVENIGRYKCTDCNEDMLMKVFEKAEEIGFWKLEKKYDPGVTDLPSTITTVNRGDSTFRVEHVMQAPESLKQLEQLIEDLYLKRKWEKTK